MATVAGPSIIRIEIMPNIGFTASAVPDYSKYERIESLNKHEFRQWLLGYPTTSNYRWPSEFTPNFNWNNCPIGMYISDLCSKKGNRRFIAEFPSWIRTFSAAFDNRVMPLFDKEDRSEYLTAADAVAILDSSNQFVLTTYIGIIVIPSPD